MAAPAHKPTGCSDRFSLQRARLSSDLNNTISPLISSFHRLHSGRQSQSKGSSLTSQEVCSVMKPRWDEGPHISTSLRLNHARLSIFDPWRVNFTGETASK